MDFIWLAALILSFGSAITGVKQLKSRLLNMALILTCMALGFGIGDAASLARGDLRSLTNLGLPCSMIFGIAAAFGCVRLNSHHEKRNASDPSTLREERLRPQDTEGSTRRAAISKTRIDSYVMDLLGERVRKEKREGGQMSCVRVDILSGQKARICLVFLAVVMASAASSGAANTKPSDLPAKVIAHLKLPEAPGSEMLLRTDENKRYVYLQKASRQGFMIINVTKPALPSLVSYSGSSSDVTAGQLEMVGPDVGLSEVTERNPKGKAQADSPAETVSILDLSDPEHPKVIQTFTGVIGKAQDARRGLIFLADHDGLWILRHDRPGITPAKLKRPCGSEDAIQSMPPDCQ
jgi:hypothetical protein